MGGPIRAGCFGEEAEKTGKERDRQGENLAFCAAPAKRKFHWDRERH